MSPPFRFEVEKPLNQYSTFGIGGPARFFIEISKIEQMQAVLSYCYQQKLPYIVIGKGSNCLFDDRGFDGLVILNKISFCQFEWPVVSVGAGYSFSLLGAQTARKGWSGLEFASGIPGSVGGAVYMNAGASGAETQESLMEVSYVNEKGILEVLPKNLITFSYRYSSFHNEKGAIVAAKFLLVPSEEARKKQLSIIEYRTRTQPYSDKSAGCIFRNPSPQSAGALIQQAGLKGTRIGGAEVSTTHANFIVNKGNAKAKDVLQLSEHVKNVVKEKTGQDLEMEIRCIPYQQ
ncbi:MAG: UDP-N-acetylmuramate dehydrogenase [Verrucomicrobia bacterium]|nr:UDP-N-acetylmuramate dehydrogenase [Verrucomicrobiota bacterium]